jgi:hypothetical protein
MDFQVVGGNRILIAESNQVTERNFKGDILWKKQVNNPMNVSRLPNGNIFIATRSQIVEVDRNGKEVSAIYRPNADVMAAHRLRDGQIALVSAHGYFCRLDATGKESKRFNLVNGVGSNYIDFTSKGNVLMPIQWNNAVQEFDLEGNIVWEGSAQQPTSAFRMPNGNTLVGTQSWPAKVFELDKNGKVIWEYQAQNYPGRVKRR